MPLWFMAFGGTIPFGNLIAGPIMDAIGARWVLGVGAVAAVGLSRWTDLDRLSPADFIAAEEVDPAPRDGPTSALRQHPGRWSPEHQDDQAGWLVRNPTTRSRPATRLPLTNTAVEVVEAEIARQSSRATGSTP